MTNPDIPKLAARLTKAQREALLVFDAKWRTSWGAIYFAHDRSPDTGEQSRLTRTARVYPKLFEQRVFGGAKQTRLAPLGLAVRQYLANGKQP